MRQTLRVTGEVVLTAGVVMLLFVCYLVWGSGIRAAQAQRALSQELTRQWAAGRHSVTTRSTTTGSIRIAPERFDVATGQPFAFIKIPAFGASWEFPLIQGTDLAQLNISPGHVPGTQWPGQIGNFAVAGHRVTSGNPFWSLPSLHAGDLVTIQTQINEFTYKVTGKQLVSPADVAVLYPVPGHPGRQPTQRLITLITCDPAWTGTHRVIVTGVLVAAQPR
jgi:sortase A